MKKFLLSALMLGGACALNAQSFDLYLSSQVEDYQVKNYQLITDGMEFETELEMGEVIDMGDFYMAIAECMAYIKIENKTSGQLTLSLGYEKEYEESNAAELGDTDMSFITCAGGACVASNPFEIKIAANGVTPGGMGEHLGYEFQCSKAGIADKLTLNAKYNFTLSGNGQTIHFSVLYKSNDTGVETIEANDANAEYFNMQGIRVANPEAGQLYIVRKGNKASKVIF